MAIKQIASHSTDGREPEISARAVRPFIKWAGGKQRLLSQLEPLFPDHFRRYMEPFTGSGAVFFHLWRQQRLPPTVFLFDNNQELVNAYRVVRDSVDALIELLTQHQREHSKAYYYHIRQLDRRDVQLSDLEWAARTIYLNKTCYNGLFRVNSKGQFNVPIGSYEKPKIVNEQRLRAASHALQEVQIEARDFRALVDLARAGDFIYFDPPYQPASKTANFTAYTAGSFGEKEQRALAKTVTVLSERGCLCMLSNSYTPLILDLYRRFRIETVRAARAINSDASRRGAVKEVVVLNY